MSIWVTAIASTFALTVALSTPSSKVDGAGDAKSRTSAERVQLPDGSNVALRDLAKEGPVAIVVMKGEWCPAWPGLTFLDRCGDVAARLAGRRPGKAQTQLILQTLRQLSELAPKCGTLSI